jgi:hypothetical protein
LWCNGGRRGSRSGRRGAAMVARVQRHDGVKLAEAARVAGGWGWRRWAWVTAGLGKSRWARWCWRFVCSSASAQNCQCSSSPGVFSRYRIYIFPKGGRISIMSNTNTGSNSNEYY